ncbi:unnamed protein product, partial [Closterium sp. NIES-53]
AQRTITLTQSHMVQQVLQRFEFTYSSPQATPLSTRHSLLALPSDESVEPSGPYPELVGCLMYLIHRSSVSSPDSAPHALKLRDFLDDVLALLCLTGFVTSCSPPLCLWGDILNLPEDGFNGERYVITFTDASTRYVWTGNMTNRFLAFTAFRTWLPLAERESDTKLKVFQCDGAGEYRSTEFTAYLQEREIRRLFSLPHAHQQSGVAERLNRTLQEKMRALLAQAQLGPLYWPFAMDHATLLHNLLSSSALPNNASPHLLWTGKLGTTKLLRVFGCVVQYRPPTALLGKFDQRAKWGLHLGIEKQYFAWRIMDYRSRLLVPARDCIFYENLTLPVFEHVLAFDAEGRAIDFDVWVDDLQLFLQCDRADGLSLFDLTSGASPAPAADADATVRSQWATRDAAARLAVRRHLPPSERAHFSPYKSAQTLCAAPGGAELRGAPPGGSPGASSLREPLSPQELREWFARRWRRVAGAGGSSSSEGAAVAGPGGARTVRTGAAGPAGSTGAGAAEGVGPETTTGGPAEGTPGAAGGSGAARGAAREGAPAGDAGAVPAVSGVDARPRPYFVPLLEQVLGSSPSTGLPPSLACPQPVQSQLQLQPTSPLPAPSPYTGPTGGLDERREPASRPASPVRAARTSGRGLRQRPPPVPGTHRMSLRPSTAPLRVPLPSPPESSLRALADPESDSLRAASPTVTRLLATVVTDPSFESTAVSALVTELVAFAASCRLDYAASLVTESASASVCPPSVGGECALGTDVLEDRQEEFQCLAATSPHLVSVLLTPEGDPDALDIPTPRSYAEAIEGPYSSQWQAAMDAEMAS